MRFTCYWAHAWMPLCVSLYSVLMSVHPASSFVPSYPAGTPTPACVRRMPQNAEQIREAVPASSKPRPRHPHPHPRSPSPPRQRKEQESIEMDRQPSASPATAKWKCQARRGCLLSVCRRARLTGEPKQNNTQPVTVNTSLFPVRVTPSLFSSAWKGERRSGEKPGDGLKPS